MEIIHGLIEWRQARPEDAAIWASLTRRSADQTHFESEDSIISGYQQEDSERQAGRYLIWRDDEPVGRLRFSTQGSSASLNGIVLVPEAGGRVAAQIASEALLRCASLNVRCLRAIYPAAYIASFAYNGFQEKRRRTGMIASSNVPLPQIPLPSSLRLRTIGYQDTESLGTLLQRAYAGGPDEIYPDLASWRNEVRLIQEGHFGPFIPEACYVVEHSLDRYHLAGAILVHLEQGIPLICHMAVAPMFRHLGLGQSLAVRALQRLGDLDYSQAMLYITLGIPAVSLYHRLGFVEAGVTYIEAERNFLH